MGKKRQIIITMDGTCGSGKSTLAKRLAGRLGLVYLDTGAMYRGLTWKALEQNADLNDSRALIVLAKNTEIVLEKVEDTLLVFVDGADVTGKIRTPRVTNAIKYLADIPEVRAEMVAQQRRIAESGSALAEGRDTGTVVFPGADYKFYVDAPLEVRLRRRHREFLQKGINLDIEEVKKDLIARDQADRSRKVGGLRVPEGAVVIDTGATDNVEENLRLLLAWIKQEDLPSFRTDDSGKSGR